MLPITEFYDINKEEKDSLYFDRMIRFIRTNMLPLINVEAAMKGLNYLLGYQDMGPIQDLFSDPSQLNLQNKPVTNSLNITDVHGQAVGTKLDMKGLRPEMTGVEFKSLPVLIKAYNIVVAEMKKMGVVTDVRANDPTSVAARDHDAALLKNRKEIEGLLSYIYTSIGQPPVSISDHAKRFNEKPDNGNVADFDKMGFDDSDPDDVGFFMDVFHKLDEEIEMEKAIHAVESYNEIQQDKIPKWTTDAVAKNAVAGMIYVSDDNGGLMTEYLSPETVFVFGSTGRREDYNDAMSKCYQQSITIKQFLDRVGDAFDWETNVNDLMLAVFYASSGAIDITGINPDYHGGSEWYCSNKKGQQWDYNNFMSFKVILGYMEWSAQDYTEFGKKMKGKTFSNEKNQNPDRPAGENNQPADGKRYQSKARYECPTYKSYYLALTTYTHIKFEAGKVSYQDIKGYNDFNSNFSIITWKGIGDSIAILAIPMIDIINEAFYKWRWILRKSKAPGVAYNMESIEKMADIMFCDTDQRENRMTKMIQHMDASSNYLYSFPEIDGKPIAMTTAQLNIELSNGLKKDSMIYWEVINTTWDKLIDMLIGNSDLRQGDSAGNRNSMNNEFKALEYSQNSTSYIPDMITFMCRAFAKRTGMLIEDVIQFKDYDTLAYKWLQNMVGDECLSKIAKMGKVAMHRYGINVESLNQSAARQKLSNRIDFALQNGKITMVQALLVEDEKSPSLATRTFAYFEQRNTKNDQKQAMQQQQWVQQGQMQLEQMKQNTEKIKIDGNIQVAQIQADATMQGHIISQQGGLAKTAMKHESDVIQIEANAQADLKKQSASIDNTNKVNAPPAPLNVPAIPQGIPQQQPPGQRQQLIDAAQPGPLGVSK